MKNEILSERVRRELKEQENVATMFVDNVGIKYDEDKPDLSLLPYNAQVGISKALMFGAKKYGRYNYLGGMKWCRLTSATLRHIFKFLNGQNIDEESGLHHLYHAGATIMMLIEYVCRGIGEDNRYGS